MDDLWFGLIIAAVVALCLVLLWPEPRRTADDVLRELADGLRNGTIVLREDG